MAVVSKVCHVNANFGKKQKQNELKNLNLMNSQLLKPELYFPRPQRACLGLSDINFINSQRA